MEVVDVWEEAQQSVLFDDPHVRLVWELVHQGPALFHNTPSELELMRDRLRRSCLDFFQRRSPYHAMLFDHFHIDPSHATIEDLAKLAIPSDLLRGDGQRIFMIPETEAGGKTFQSSGTTGKEPVMVYRSPLDLALMQRATTDLFEHVRGNVYAQDKGTVLMMAAPEMKERMAFVSFVDLTVGNKGARLMYGMDLLRDEKGEVRWGKLETNKENIIAFMRSRDEPKLLFAPPVVIDMLSKRFGDMGPLQRLASRLTTSAPPLQMGRGGIVITAGGSKKELGLPSTGPWWSRPESTSPPRTTKAGRSRCRSWTCWAWPRA